VRATDRNGLAYGGLTVTATAAAGTVTPAETALDTAGEASFEWLTPEGSGRLEVKLAGGGTVEVTR
jgi:hypothetical protein